MGVGASASATAGIFGSEGLMDSEMMMAAGGRRYRSQPRGPWSFLYGHQNPKHHRVGGNINNGKKSFIRKTAFEYAQRPRAQDNLDSSSGNLDDEFEGGHDVGIEVGIDENEIEYEEENVDPISTTESSQGLNPKKTYVDIWNEGPDLLSEEDYIDLEDGFTVISKGRSSRRLQTLDDRMDPETKYLTYLPDSGISNQFQGMLRAMMLAKTLGRTLILPPITASNQHDYYNSDDSDDKDISQQNQLWSSFFELDTFKQLTGVKVVEFQDLGNLDQITFSTQEKLKCHITCGVGSLRPLDSTAKEFVRQWKFDLSLSQLGVDTDKLNELTSALKGQDKEHLLCISNAYNIVVPENEEWNLFGRHLYFNPTFEGVFSKTLQGLNEKNTQREMSRQHQYISDKNSGRAIQSSEEYVSTAEQYSEPRVNKLQLNDNNDSYDHGLINSAIIPNIKKLYRNAIDVQSQVTTAYGPYISIHARRGDYVDYCQQHFRHALQSCLPTTYELASMLYTVLQADPTLKGLPVYVSTDENRTEELDEFRAMGWHVLDHQAMGSKELLGVFGPMMMDQIFMAKAQVLIGVRTSAFSRLGANRQEDWYGRRAVFM
ncbi:hypothetical protein BGZ49_007106 [Haplosporangium sp. Z 27]|nr:hypothetical protein BGZ49_007106 [Haplosporangium sp. Z 27]